MAKKNEELNQEIDAQETTSAEAPEQQPEQTDSSVQQDAAETGEADETGEAVEADASTDDDTEKAESKMLFIKQEKTDKAYWYVVYTYSGYENKVKTNLDKTIENLGLQDSILDVKVPMEETIEIKNGKKKHVQRKMFPGYVMVKMFLTDDTWYVVRNTRGVTGFVGPGSKPIPLSDAEVRSMGVEDIPIKLDVEVGESIIITSGPFESFIGVVEEVSTEKQKVKVIVAMFGRDTSIELDFVQVKRI